MVEWKLFLMHLPQESFGSTPVGLLKISVVNPLTLAVLAFVAHMLNYDDNWVGVLHVSLLFREVSI